VGQKIATNAKYETCNFLREGPSFPYASLSPFLPGLTYSAIAVRVLVLYTRTAVTAMPCAYRPYLVRLPKYPSVLSDFCCYIYLISLQPLKLEWADSIRCLASRDSEDRGRKCCSKYIVQNELCVCTLIDPYSILHALILCIFAFFS